MDTQSKDILEQLLKRLDKIENQQHKLDRVMERLDTLQNILERQNQKQNLLDEILVKMAIKPEQDKVVTTELHGAQQDSVQSFCVTDGKEDSAAQPFQGWGKQTEDTLKSIDDRTVDTEQKCRQLISWSQKIEEKLTDDNRENMKTFLAEIRSAKDLIKGQSNSELIWLNNQIDKKLSDIVSVVREIYQQQTEAKEEIVCSVGQVVKTAIHHDKQQGSATVSLGDKQKSSTEISDKQMQTILDLERSIQQLYSSVCDVPREMKTSLDTMTTTNKQFIINLENIIRNSIVEMNENSKEQTLSVNESIKSGLNKLREAVQSELQTSNKMFIAESETQYCKIINTSESAIEDIKHLIQTEGGNTSKYKDELENIYMLINPLIGNLQENMTTIVKEVESTKTSMISGHATVNKNLEELTVDLKDYIYQTKREIFAVTEKEAQIVRDQLLGSLLSQGKYTFDFFVHNFKTIISRKKVESLPWHIKEMQSCVTGQVRMQENGKMEVRLLYGRHPHEVGLQTRSGKKLVINATIFDNYKKELPPVYVGGMTTPFDETEVKNNRDWGIQVGVISFDELLQKGYGEKEGYLNEALLIRYEVEVL